MDTSLYNYNSDAQPENLPVDLIPCWYLKKPKAASERASGFDHKKHPWNHYQLVIKPIEFGTW